MKSQVGTLKELHCTALRRQPRVLWGEIGPEGRESRGACSQNAELSPEKWHLPLSPYCAFLPHIKHQMDKQLSENTVCLLPKQEDRWKVLF